MKKNETGKERRKKSHASGLGTQLENYERKLAISDGLGLRTPVIPVIQKTFRTKSEIPLSEHASASKHTSSMIFESFFHAHSVNGCPRRTPSTPLGAPAGSWNVCGTWHVQHTPVSPSGASRHRCRGLNYWPAIHIFYNAMWRQALT